MIRYRVSYTNPLTNFFRVEMLLDNLNQPLVDLQLPAWRPGRYELQNFAQKIRGFQVSDQNGQPLEYEKITKDHWRVQTQNTSALLVSYDFYARQMDAGGSWLDENQLYINGVNCFMAMAGRELEPCELTLEIPEYWQIACGLKQVDRNVLRAENFDQLVDCPLIASPTLQHEVYTVQNIPFHVWIQGDCRPDWPRLLADFRDFTEEQMHLFHGFPEQDYHFLFQVLPYKHYHGVEHSNSTTITLGPSETLMEWSSYKELLGVSCHELFHTWNIKKIRPAEMMPYDFTCENYFRTGFVAEGITTYYGDYLLARSGVFSAEKYFEELNGVLKKHFDDYGRNNYSVADSSFDMWLDGYKPAIPDRRVSIYHKGALAALLLDLELRRTTENHRSLDEVMRRLWHEYGKASRGYTEQDYMNLVSETAGSSFQHYFDSVIYGTAPLEPLLNSALRYIGCELKIEKSNAGYETRFGFRTIQKAKITTVSAIAPNSPAALTLSTDDEIIAVNGRKVDENLEKLLAGKETVELTVFRGNYLRLVQLNADGTPYFQKYTVAKRNEATISEKENFKLWLNQEF